MNMRSPELLFRSNRRVVAASKRETGTPASVDVTPDHEVKLERAAETYVLAEPKADRLLLCIKTRDMAELVSSALGHDDDVVVDVAEQSLIDIANNDTLAISDYDIVVLDIEPGNESEMDALRCVTSRAPETTRFLAIIPEALTLTVARDLTDAGVIEVLTRSSMHDAKGNKQPVNDTVVQSNLPQHNGVVVAIAQTRGGIGATTLAINLAAMLSAPKSKRNKTPGARVALLDLDFQNGDAAASIDIEDNGAFIEMLKSRGHPDAAFLRSALISYKGQFDVLPTPMEFAPFDALTPEMAALMVNELRLMYDYVILGMPRAMVRWIEPVLARADQLLLVTDTTVTGIRQARRLIDFYTEDNPGLPLDIVMSKEKKPMSAPKSVKEAAKFLDKPFDTWLPYDERAAGKATDRGVPMVEAAKRSAVVKPLRQIIGRLQGIHDSDKRREA